MVLHKTEEMMVQLVSLDNAINCALGLGGGLPAHPGDYRFREGGLPRDRLAGGVLPGTPDALERDVGRLTRLFAKEITMMHPGDVFVAQYCGGGGFGDPLTRRPELVADDVRSGAITVEDARELYGVVLDGSGSADPTATDGLRARMRGDRLAGARPPGARDDVILDRERYTGSAGGAVGLGLASDGEEHWGCLECGHALAPIDQNYKDGAARLERAPQEISPRQYLDPREFCDDPFVVREFLCPGCGVALATELCKPDDPPVVDARLSGRAQVTA
jgi:N-methylhydantoinase B